MKRLYPQQPIVGVGAIILQNGKILLGKRKNEPAKGKWAVPGGAVELGETPEEAAIRETYEETCLQVENPQLIDVVCQVDRDNLGKVRYHYIIIDYVVSVKMGKPEAASDTEDIRWVEINDVENYDLTPSFRRLFSKNRNKIAEMALG